MTDTLAYDDTEARQEEAIHETSAVADRRRRVREALGPRGDEAVLSIGCGPGFEPAGLAPAVGTEGHVHGVDRSAAMLALAARRCADLPQVSLARGDATALPVADGAFDAAVAVQVYEYVEDLGAAVAELARVLRPGGRAVVYDTDFDSLVWRSAAPERMRRILDAFEDHCPRPRLGSSLAPHLLAAGLTVERIEPNTILNTRLAEDTFVRRLATFLRAYATAHDDVAAGEPDAWIDDLRELDDSGGTFFSLTQYLYVVRAAE